MRPGASAGAYANLLPRQPITATPYAIRALSAGLADSAGTANGVPMGAINALALAGNAVNSAKILDGSITNADLHSNLLNHTFWKLGGNDVAPGQFLGTTNNQPLDIRVLNQRALRLEPRGVGLAPSLVGGYHENTAGSFFGAAIAGGGTNGAINSADGNYSFIGAGIGAHTANSAFVGAGAYNSALGHSSLVGSGYANTNRGNFAAIVAGANNFVALGAYSAFIGAGVNNQALGAVSTIGGGDQNTSGGESATVGGGTQNSSIGGNATLPGGESNSAAGGWSFAAGQRAKANHTGAFVWADATDADFASTATNQFLIRASGGVGIGTPNPATSLEIRRATAAGPSLRLTGVGSFGSKVGIDLATYDPVPFGVLPAARIEASDVNWSASIDFQTKVPGASDNALASRLFIQNGGNVGIGKTTPATALDVNGIVTATALHWSSSGELTDDQGGSMELGDSARALAIPFIDFHYGASGNQDYNVRLINDGDRRLSVYGDFRVTGIVSAASFSGNAGTPLLLGTTDNQPLEFKVNGTRALRLEPTADSPNIIGGYSGNVVSNGFLGATIGGGGRSGSENRIGASFATVGGGYKNTASDDGATVGGGERNTSSSSHATVGDGWGNTSSNYAATVGGGRDNTSGGVGATVGGGGVNTSSGSYATVPGGSFNSAAGGGSFAAGFRAEANHDGAFVWADVQTFEFASTGNDQFSVRASGGVRFVTAIDANGNPAAGVTLASGGTTWGTISDRNAKKNFQPVDGQAVLEKLAQMPVQRWNYKCEDDQSTPHIGPMAQDFKAAFFPGRDDKVITTLEFDGVELAAIQGLNEKVESGKRKAENRMERLEAENVELKSRLTALEKLVRISARKQTEP